jgi:hypothetical protein
VAGWVVTFWSGEVQRFAQGSIGAGLPAAAIGFKRGKDIGIKVEGDALLALRSGQRRAAEFAVGLKDFDEYGDVCGWALTREIGGGQFANFALRVSEGRGGCAMLSVRGHLPSSS